MKGINSKHRKHYKAGSVWKPGEQQERDKAAASWAERMIEYLRRIRGKKV